MVDFFPKNVKTRFGDPVTGVELKLLWVSLIPPPPPPLLLVDVKCMLGYVFTQSSHAKVSSPCILIKTAGATTLHINQCEVLSMVLNSRSIQNQYQE